MKLTEAQRELLALAVSKGRVGCIESYRPAIKLIDLGLAVKDGGKSYGYMHIRPTDAGRVAHSSHQRGET